MRHLMKAFFITSCITMASASVDDGRPNEHFCPISLGVMQNPVVAGDGHTYERISIETWLAGGHDKGPLTGELLPHGVLTPNLALKKMIEEWRPNKQAKTSDFDKRPSKEIAEKITQAFKEQTTQSSKGKHIVAFLGNTGAGKSTLINLLAGKKLVRSKDQRSYVLEDDQDGSAMKIGRGGESQTRFPQSIDVNVPGVGELRFFDLPGFNDTNGSEKNLVNAALTRRVLSEAASVRLMFVVGEDQFTADKSASVRSMFHALKHLFVSGEQDADSILNQGTFVGTKILGVPDDVVDFFLQRTDSQDKAELNAQLNAWKRSNRIHLIPHAIMNPNLEDVKRDMTVFIGESIPLRIVGVNVSALYPPETANDLQRVFEYEMETAFKRKVGEQYKTVSEYDDAIIHWQDHERFWQDFDRLMISIDHINLLRDFAFNSYKRAKNSFVSKNEADGLIEARLRDLRGLRKQRVEDVENRTDTKAQEVVSALVRPANQRRVMFDFAYHKGFYENVCGANNIINLATDPKEQEIVRQYYAGFIADHSHEQMMRWHQRYSGHEQILERLAILEARALPPSVVAVDRLIGDGIVIPDIARCHEADYRMFLNSKLIYKPDPNSDAGKLELPVLALANPLSGEFDLSRCGDTGQYLSINTGYRTGQRPENANKVEVWFALRFMVEKDIAGPAKHLQPIMDKWPATNPVGIFWTWGGWSGNEQMAWYYYLTTQHASQLSNGEDLFEKLSTALGIRMARPHFTWRHKLKHFIFSLQTNK